MRERKTEAEIDNMQELWGGQPCNHDCGYGIEWNSAIGCETDYYCLRCGFRYYNADFFNNREKNT